MSILLSTIILSFQMLTGTAPTATQLNSTIAADQTAGYVVVVDTTYMN